MIYRNLCGITFTQCYLKTFKKEKFKLDLNIQIIDETGEILLYVFAKTKYFFR